MRNSRRRRVRARQIQHHLNAIRGQHLQRAGAGGGRQRMGVDAHEQWPVDALGLAVITEGLRDGQDMPFVERAVERRTPVAGGAKRDTLRRNRWVGRVCPIGGNQFRHVDQRGERRHLTSEWADAAGRGLRGLRWGQFWLARFGRGTRTCEAEHFCAGIHFNGSGE